jgi:hypothetical protein
MFTTILACSRRENPSDGITNRVSAAGNHGSTLIAATARCSEVYSRARSRNVSPSRSRGCATRRSPSERGHGAQPSKTWVTSSRRTGDCLLAALIVRLAKRSLRRERTHHTLPRAETDRPGAIIAVYMAHATTSFSACRSSPLACSGRAQVPLRRAYAASWPPLRLERPGQVDLKRSLERSRTTRRRPDHRDSIPHRSGQGCRKQTRPLDAGFEAPSGP